MAVNALVMTVEEFDEWVFRPENVDHDYEYIGGEVVSIITSPFASSIAAQIGAIVGEFVQKHNLGHVTGAAGGYKVAGEYYLPDVGFISKKRQATLKIDSWYVPQPPDLAVEVVSPEIRLRSLLIKISNYLAAGTEVWVVYPDDEQVHVHTPGKPVEIIKKDGTVDGAGLPGFTLPLANIFN